MHVYHIPSVELPVESWRPISEDSSRYEVSDRGRVVDTWIDEELDQHFFGSGHVYVTINGRRRSIHRLVLIAFDRLPHLGEIACHLNGIADDNRAENLVWGDGPLNAQHRDFHAEYGNIPYDSSKPIRKPRHMFGHRGEKPETNCLPNNGI